MSSAHMRVECRKFAPNIFNKTKCSNCFRQKEEHSAEALESNRAARKISKCGYLFVAPGWDFTNPINRTKRWQRRWFVLYDDGELSYSVDEHPETVPQASIDMNKVLDVTDAEEVTGNSYSLAITAPDTVHFVKGTCREEAKWWKEVLSVYPRSKGRHKRNATFPGSQTSALLQQTSLGCRSPGEAARPRFNSCHGESGILVRQPSSTWLCVDEENIFSVQGSADQIDSPITATSAPTSTQTAHTLRESLPSAKPTITGMTYKDPVPSAQTTIFRDTTSPSTPSKKSARSCLSYRDSPPPSSPKSPPVSVIGYKETTSPSNTLSGLTYRECSPALSSNSSSLSSLTGGNLSGQPATSSSPPTRDKLHAEEKARARREKRGRSLTEQIRREKLKDIADRLTSPRVSPRASLPCIHPPPTRESDKIMDEPVHDTPVRGDPDGCGLDPSTLRYSPSAELRVALPAEDLLNMKKGWLMKQAGTEWTKHWFVLRGAALMYYRDPTAEDKGILDGVLDLGCVRAVAELQVQRNHGFQVVCWDERRFVLSAVTAGIRTNWISAIRRAAGLGESPSRSMTIGEKLERELQESNPRYFDPPSSLPSGLERSPSSHTCADTSPTSYLGHDGPAWGHPVTTPLPPSPPLTRTPISRVKERAKTQVSRSRVYNKRSKSSPPTSRRNTLDTIRVPPVRQESDSFTRRQSFSKVLDEPVKSGDWTDSSVDKPWSLKLEETSLMRGRSVDSLSDLTNIDLDLDLSTLDKARVVEEYEELRGRFEKAVMEIRAMKRELRQSHRACDELELTGIRLRQDAKLKEESDAAEAKLMAARVQDLALKLSAAEKQVRALKQKTTKAESREKRRTLSLKGSESFHIGREVEEKLTELENKLAALESGQESGSTGQKPVAKPRIRRKSLDSATLEPITVLLRLSSLEGRLSLIDKRKQNDVRQAASTLISQLEKMLRLKLTELAERRQRLAASGNLDTSTRLRLAAERIAVESVLVRKVLDAARSFGQGKPIPLASDVQEIQALMVAVRRRMRGDAAPLESPLDCLTDSVTRALTAVGDVVSESRKFDPTVLEAEITDLETLLENQRNLHGAVEAFRAATVPQVARGLTLETLCLTAEYEEGRSRSDENQHLREAWAQAQEALNRELVQAELSHVAMRWSANAEGGARMSWLGLYDTSREACAATVSESLRGIMDNLIEELTAEYENCLTCMRRPTRMQEDLEKEASESRALLERLVSVIASMALIDARISQLVSASETTDGRPVVRSVSLKPVPDVDVETECMYLFHRIAAETASSADALCVSEACSAVATCIEKAKQLMSVCGLEGESTEDDAVSWSSLLEQCEWLSATLETVLERVSNGGACARCPVLQASLEELEKKQEEEAKRLRDRHDWQLQELRGELESQRDSLVCQHELEQAQLLEKARRLERRLGTLDSEYAHQMDNLRAAYQKTLSTQLNRDGDVEESIRQRYQAEIQQLRALCEKGLIAVDNSHRRIISEMEDKHRQELAAAAAEKDQALAEETQATLAALDAMRKAHETEVQREVSKFKAEWLRRVQSAHDVTALHQAHEEEMEEIKAEILSLSERYSDKCVETAKLEEELARVTKQLVHAQQTCSQLDTRNRQLRTQLSADVDGTPFCIQDEILHGWKLPHEKQTDYDRCRFTPSIQCRGGDNTRILPNQESERIIVLSPPGCVQMLMASNNDGGKNRITQTPGPPVLPREELLRDSVLKRVFPSPSLGCVSGLVAERKKLFERLG